MVPSAATRMSSLDNIIRPCPRSELAAVSYAALYFGRSTLASLSLQQVHDVHACVCVCVRERESVCVCVRSCVRVCARSTHTYTHMLRHMHARARTHTHTHTFNHFAEHHVPAVQPRRLHSSDEKLKCVHASVFVSSNENWGCACVFVGGKRVRR